MNLELNLDENQQHTLMQLAEKAGLDVDAYLSKIVKEQIAPVSEQSVLDGDEWQRRFDALVARHQPTGYELDDSRESIYPDRL